ncbi:MAG: methyl-accepting chemotaxis protein [Desulfobacterium sp.]|nr:methyl-accepting chemotaxis protein [Desulfobacterium sp.]MBU3948268.1 methyl-accepting chemotaxis protein [Pseudomonadota bacterium]MBU4037175.1 methyl-accepting chemotaxis protein [Pseudomonadota bacterium]
MGRTSIKNKLIMYFLVLLLIVIVVIEVVNQTTKDFFLAQGLSIALAMAIGTVFGIIFSRSITLRLKKLSDAAGKISCGDLTQEIQIISSDEVRDLEEIFSLMVNHLRALLIDMKNVSLKIHNTNSILKMLAKKLLQNSNEIDITAKIIAESSAKQTEIVHYTTIKLNNSIKVMDKLVQQSSQTISKADAAIKKTQKGESNAREIISHLELVLKQMSESAQPLSRLPEKVEKIKIVMNVIEAISQKTDLLSLNASIEATRAGESGKGFAIVAEEIRNMAESSKQSSKAIAKLVEDILEDNQMLKEFLTKNQSEIDKGNKIIHGIVQTFSDMLLGVKDIFSEIKSMEDATVRQAQELRSFSEHFQKLSVSASRNYDSTQKTTVAAANQKNEVKRMASAINLLDKLSKKMLETQQQFSLPEQKKQISDKPEEED